MKNEREGERERERVSVSIGHLNVMKPSHLLALCCLGIGASAHEYMSAPLARSGQCLLNGVIMGNSICQTTYKGDDQQCLDDPLEYAHLFHVHPAFEGFACGGSTRVHGRSGGSQGILQACGDMASNASLFNMSVPGTVNQYRAGEEVEVGLHGFSSRRRCASLCIDGLDVLIAQALYVCVGLPLQRAAAGDHSPRWISSRWGSGSAAAAQRQRRAAVAR